MQIELTGRAVTISQKLRAQVEAGVARVEKIVGRKSTAHVVLGSTKHGKVAEVAIKAKLHDLYAQCEAEEIEPALHDALAKVEKQALKYKNRLATMKRHPEKTAVGSVRLQVADEDLKTVKRSAVKAANGKTKKNGAAVEFAAETFTEAHLVRTTKGIARRPMAMEEALKEAAGLERPLFVFRDLADQAIVLHRLHDGRVEVIEVP